jgi:hypothetical protein
MGIASLRSEMACGAETSQQVRHVVIVLQGRCAESEDPFEKVRVGAIEQSLEPVELCAVHVRERCLGEPAENEIALLRSAVPTAEEQAPAADIQSDAR